MPTDNSSRPCPWCKIPVPAKTTRTTEPSETLFARWHSTEASGHCSRCGMHVLWNYDLRPVALSEVHDALDDHFRAIAHECGVGELWQPPERPKAN